MDRALYLSPQLRRLETAHADLPLMQRAGTAAAALARQLLADQEKPVLLLAGPGNNGGDAFVTARLLHAQGVSVHLVAPGGTSQNLPPDAHAARAEFLAAGGKILTEIPEHGPWGLIVDGLFGIGLKRAPESVYAASIQQMNHLARRDACPLLALDCPSGLDADSGLAARPTVQATHTLCFIGRHPGLYTHDGPDYSGDIRLATLELPPSPDFQADGHLLARDDFAAHLLPRRRNSHKGSYGSVGVLGGSKAMAGAAFLAARAALLLGSGRVYLGLLDADAPSLDLLQPELMLRRPDQLFHADLDALACGPGLGQSSEAADYLEQALKSPLPLVLDADALNLLARDSRLQGNLYNRIAPALLTPHPAEAARLLGSSTRDVQADRIGAALEIARNFACPIALKGCGTVIALPDGAWSINESGNPGLASAGMGDVLTGITLALLGQHWPPASALAGAVHLHGCAADALVAAAIGPAGLTASELILSARRLFNTWSRQTI
ncbi:NAD(P)H-hydrate dehydratase [Azonexus sp.]|uniref:NAD(P)H-hydrate dehydratase n=1 Tax=Azonexus sp. TaxID=1872668 RepID=UPI0039E59E27